MDQEERLACVRLHLTPGIGPRLFSTLVERFGSARAVVGASADALARVPRIGADLGETLRRAIDEADPSAEVARAEAAGASIIVRGEPQYPLALTYMVDAPPVLYVKGTLAPEDAQAIAIVGMRKCSLYGEDQAGRLASGLVRAGFTIVSGLARGIDSAAHRAALAAGGRTLAVLGTGLAHIYPPENRKLAETIVQRGALISEFPMEVGPAAENFPRRNRIIAGLALGVIVAEAGKHSGSLITARLAAELGKEVFALPNRVDAPGAAGVHALIRDGAKLVESVADVLDEFPDLCPSGQASPDEPRQGQLDLRMNLSPEETQLLEALDGDPVPLDVLVQRTGLPPARISGALTLLELKGLVRAVAGGLFARRRHA